jgi:hypothetical protein
MVSVSIDESSFFAQFPNSSVKIFFASFCCNNTIIPEESKQITVNIIKTQEPYHVYSGVGNFRSRESKAPGRVAI